MFELITYFLMVDVEQIQIDYEFIQMTRFIFLEPNDLWDIFYLNLIRDLLIPCMKRRYLKNKRDLIAWVCTCKESYINGYHKIADNL